MPEMLLQQENQQNIHTLPFISVVVPVRNEAPFLRATLNQLLEQDYHAHNFEVIVVDGQSTDHTPAVVRALQGQHANLHLLANPKRWSSAGRNLGVLAAQGEYVVIVDGHCDLANPAYLRAVASAFVRSGADCLGRPQPLDMQATTPLQRAIAAARACWLGHHPASFIYATGERFVPAQSVAVAYRRSAFAEAGLFDENFDACEDVEFNHRLDRAGLRCFFTPTLRAHYRPRSSLAGLYRQMFRYGRGRVRLLRKHPDSWSLAGFIPGLLVAGIVIGAVLATFSSGLAYAYAAVLGAYGLAVGLTSLTISFKAREPLLFKWLPAVFVAIHGGAGAGILWELAVGWMYRGGQRIGHDSTLKEVPPKGYAINNPRVHEPARSMNGQIRNALTIDVEDYYHVSAFESRVARASWDSYESRVVASTGKILDALAEGSVQGTFFILGWVANRHPDLVRRIQRAGHEIGCHGYWHRLVYQQTRDEFRQDVRLARNTLQHITGSAVQAYRAPSFSITRKSLWALDILIEEGFTTDSSIYPTCHDRYGIAGAPVEPHCIVRPSGQIHEFPLPIYRRFGLPLPIGGGGYLRLYPYWFTRHGLRAINRSGRLFAVYLHPWELDPNQPRLAAGWMRTFRHYVNLQRTSERLSNLLRDFHFGTISQVLESLNVTARGQVPQWDLARAA